jgi:hypothetical protein
MASHAAVDESAAGRSCRRHSMLMLLLLLQRLL